MVFSGLTVIIQFSTFGYCIKVYLASLSDSSTTTNSSGLPSYSNSVVTVTPRQAYRRVRRVVELQWRGIAIVIIIITDVIFFAVVFILLDSKQNAAANDVNKSNKSRLWLDCLALNPDDKKQCLGLTSDLTINQATITAVLVLLSVCLLRSSYTWLSLNMALTKIVQRHLDFSPHGTFLDVYRLV